MTKQEVKAADRRVELAYYAGCSNIQIPMMKITDIFRRGRELVAAGASDAALKDGIRAYVETIKVS